MKIIKSGKTRSKWSAHKIECNCGCVFALEDNDRPKFVADQRDGNYYEVKCPECKTVNAVDANLLNPRGSR